MPLNKKMLPRREYINFAQTAIDYLKHEQRAIIISPSPYKNGYTFKFAFKTKGELVDIETLNPRDTDLPDALPDGPGLLLFAFEQPLPLLIRSHLMGCSIRGHLFSPLESSTDWHSFLIFLFFNWAPWTRRSSASLIRMFFKT